MRDQTPLGVWETTCLERPCLGGENGSLFRQFCTVVCFNDYLTIEHFSFIFFGSINNIKKPLSIQYSVRL